MPSLMKAVLSLECLDATRSPLDRARLAFTSATFASISLSSTASFTISSRLFLYLFCAVRWARCDFPERVGFDTVGSFFDSAFGVEEKRVDGSSRSEIESVSSPSELMTISLPPLIMRRELLSRIDGGTVKSMLWKLSSRIDGFGGLSKRVLDSDACSWAPGPLRVSEAGVSGIGVGVGVGVGVEKPWNDDGGGSDSGEET